MFGLVWQACPATTHAVWQSRAARAPVVGSYRPALEEICRYRPALMNAGAGPERGEINDQVPECPELSFAGKLLVDGRVLEPEPGVGYHGEHGVDLGLVGKAMVRHAFQVPPYLYRTEGPVIVVLRARGPGHAIVVREMPVGFPGRSSRGKPLRAREGLDRKAVLSKPPQRYRKPVEPPRKYRPPARGTAIDSGPEHAYGHGRVMGRECPFANRVRDGGFIPRSIVHVLKIPPRRPAIKFPPPERAAGLDSSIPAGTAPHDRSPARLRAPAGLPGMAWKYRPLHARSSLSGEGIRRNPRRHQ